jgi:protein-L-isoaspartate(D-aspartate) O-methyltransferase
MSSNGRNSLVSKAFAEVDRADFVLSGYRNSADLDIPLPISEGQTISQPTTVQMMLKWLDVRPGDKVLDVGSGSGWTTALLAKIVGTKGEVYAVERIPELKRFGEKNCQKAGIKNIKFFLAGNRLGLPKFAPFDRILVSAAAKKLPNSLINQLKIGGKLVIPIENSVFEIKKRKSKLESIEHRGFIFVPLIDT